MSIEHELGELTATVKSLVKGQDRTIAKLDNIDKHQAVLLEAHDRNKKLTFFAITTALGAGFTAFWSIITTGNIPH